MKPIITVFFLSSAFLGVSAEASKVVKVKSIYWSDADSGRINGSLKFRLNSVDAPETGGVGAAIGGAQCEKERELGFEAKEWIVGFTNEKALDVSKDYGEDRYGRLIIDLSSGGVDVGREGVSKGHLKEWPHEGSKTLSSKPIWC